jgi:hypothetical protein
MESNPADLKGQLLRLRSAVCEFDGLYSNEPDIREGCVNEK